ncbi:acyltransferase [Cellulophaga fucicola]|uniref:Surface polysaccharide O-acyltransferase, integral membrane enzyme n=1 Tax=Cellulophaga fucicola TaxID=76595 RepID=A0A1K1M0C9_9FLAO|nr:acyltransferase [Cellulophaga fucicola]SFW16595.1 Surface polysaccharide O-acyltransferase, integral membrane enzyme [Cellulophaga fucicola]
MESKRIHYIDNLRVLACFLVILTHSAMSTKDSYGFYAVIISLLGNPSSELFLTISGALLLPTRIKMKEFYIKRFSRLALPVLFWSLIILLIQYLIGVNTLGITIKKLILIPLSPVTGVYWFIYTICGLYLLAPVISPWIIASTKKEYQFILLLWLCTILLPYISFILPDFYHIDGNYYFILNYFGGFLGYMLLGVYLRKYPIILPKIKAILLIASLVTLAILPILYCYLFNRELINIINNNLSISSVLLVTAIFIFFQNFGSTNIKFNNFINYLAKYTFGIYLVHIIIVRNVVQYIYSFYRTEPINPLIESPLIAITSMIVSFLCVKLISKLPQSKNIVGV